MGRKKKKIKWHGNIGPCDLCHQIAFRVKHKKKFICIQCVSKCCTKREVENVD